MYVSHVSLTNFRSYRQVDLELGPGTTVFAGPNGVGKTNIAEALGYLASLSSHRVSNDAPLIHFGADQALVRARIHRAQQAVGLELEITAGKANRARINRANPVRAREIMGIVRTVLFAPEDLALVKGDPSERRRYLDDVLVALQPHQAATRSDYDRVLKQRNALLKSARSAGRLSSSHEATLSVWDQHLAAAGSKLLRGRLDVLDALQGHLSDAYAGLTDGSKAAIATYTSSIAGGAELDDGTAQGADAAPTPEARPLSGLDEGELHELFLEALAAQRGRELDRGLTLVGPHRDDLVLGLGSAPAKGYASHGETWSLALSLRLAVYRALCQDDSRPGAKPILILDDVFAELDVSRRRKLAQVVADAEQVIVTAAVVDDVPEELHGRILTVGPGTVSA
ncbi:DNA replication/repair protein RecF [Arthrobacter sp. JSM 101049]|uniref:DNA replication/repair protein RecF n=1 Tax=Arthrobacter sp. JSM 101049 TaxID=929097 RepID=UPI0035629E71